MESFQRKHRQVRVLTASGPVEGSLLVVHGRRTLDELNTHARGFVTLLGARRADGTALGAGTLEVNKSGILFVCELDPPEPKGVEPFAEMRNIAVGLSVGGYEVEGYVCVLDGGSPLKRLEHDGHDFLPVTSVLLRGPHGEDTLPFLAVNRQHVTMAYLSESATPEPETVSDVAAV